MRFRSPEGFSAAEIESRYKSYATPVIGPLVRILREEALHEKGFLDALESATMYVSLVAFAYYYRVGHKISAINKAMNSIVQAPAFGAFARLLREVVIVFEADKSPLMTGIAEFYHHGYAPDDKDSTLEQISFIAECIDLPESRYEKSNKGLLDVIIEFRNSSAHGPYSNAGTEKRIHNLIKLMDAFLATMNNVATLPLLEIRDYNKEQSTYSVYQWQGVQSRETLLQTSARLEKNHIYIKSPEEDDTRAFLDLFPFYLGWECMDTDGQPTPQLLVQNGVKADMVEYVTYQSGQMLKLTKQHPLYPEIRKGFGQLKKFLELTGKGAEAEGLPPWIRLDISDESLTSYSRAEADYNDGDIENAIIHLKDAIDKSPVYTDAVKWLATLLWEENRLEEAHDVLEKYLGYFPKDIPCQLQDARILFDLKRYADVKGKIERIKNEEPDNHEVAALEDDLASIDPEADAVSVVTLGAKISPSLVLPYEYFLNCLPFFSKADDTHADRPANKIFTRKWVPAILTIVVISITGTAFMLFKEPDFVMALTLLAMGALWGVIIWATFHMRKLIEASQANFKAFLKIRKGRTPSDVFYEVVMPIFGNFQLTETGLKGLIKGISSNKRRFCFIVPGAVILTAIFFYISNHSVYFIPSYHLIPSPRTFFTIAEHSISPFSANVLYGILVFFMSMSLFYYISCIVLFHRQLNPSRFPDIEFNLVQHPKHSIRYLSHLSRKLSYSQLLVYVMATFTMYLGPFRANIHFVLLMSALILAIIYSYYNTIVLIRRVIVNKKWRLISRFSRHFDRPFNQLIDKGEPTALEDVRKLLSARNFVDSMSAWPEKRMVLLFISVIYISVIVLSTIGLSNYMTRDIVPKIYSYAKVKNAKYNEKGSRKKSELLMNPEEVQGLFGTVENTAASLDKDTAEDKTDKTIEDKMKLVPYKIDEKVTAKQIENGTVNIKVQGVDDTVIVFWAKDINELTDTINEVTDTLKQVRKSIRTGINMDEGACNCSEEKKEDRRCPSPSFCRCDWTSADHGNMEFFCGLKNARQILVIAYNKIYHDFILNDVLHMGGGKLSYDIRINLRDDTTNGRVFYKFKEKSFIRMNTMGIEYSALLNFYDENGRKNIPRDLKKRLITAIVNLGKELNENEDESKSIDENLLKVFFGPFFSDD